VTYHYNKNNDSDPRLYGFVAQEVEKVFPEFVSIAGNGYKGIAYNNFSVIAIQAIREQQQIINELKSRIEVLEKSLQKSHE
jgi:Holliday junction resolvasome RuvABC DNA-binding subunit